MEPWISVAQKWGLRILIESHSTRSEAGRRPRRVRRSPRMFRAQAKAVELLENDPTPFVHYLTREAGGLLEPHELQTWRLLHADRSLHARALRGHLRMDGEVDMTCRRDLREHRPKPGVE